MLILPDKSIAFLGMSEEFMYLQTGVVYRTI